MLVCPEARKMTDHLVNYKDVTNAGPGDELLECPGVIGIFKYCNKLC